ncbi:HIT family protein [Orenia marismortui]|uniref:HIT family protein n=1 Tax=Orenia marismortui TaxID=46469 RepID=UPI0012FA5778
MMECIFCNTEELEIILESQFSFAIFDKYPVNKGHLLIIPKRHFSSFFELSKEEMNDIYDLINQGKEKLDKLYSPDGYNIGVNVGETAGQTIMHLHIHIIPRYKGDIENPRGGIRKLMPNLVPYDG